METRGRKATDPLRIAGLPTEKGSPAFFCLGSWVVTDAIIDFMVEAVNQFTTQPTQRR